jgi:hypothetical protein
MVELLSTALGAQGLSVSVLFTTDGMDMSLLQLLSVLLLNPVTGRPDSWLSDPYLYRLCLPYGHLDYHCYDPLPRLSPHLQILADLP